MPVNDAGNVVGDDDDFTYTEDVSGHQKKVPVEKEFIFKVVVVGDYSVGKTSLIKRLLAIHSLAHHRDKNDKNMRGGRGNVSDVANTSSDEEDEEDSDDDAAMTAVTPTVGTDFYSLSLPQVVPGASVRLQLWDTAGLEKYAAKYENTFRNVSFVICVFDVTSASSLHNVVDRHLSIAAEHIPDLDQSNIMVVANKIDIIEDMENTTTALRDARKRAQSPETAFDDTHDDDTATNTDFFTSADGVDKDAIVTAKNVQAEVFDIFGEVHYAEVSAKTRQNVRQMLETVAFALLRNSAEAHGVVEVPETESTYEIFAHTVLPMQTPGTSPVRHAGPGLLPSPKVEAPKPPQPPTPPPPKSLSLSKPDADEINADEGEKNGSTAASSAPPKPAAPASSWSTRGAFKFDMAPMQFDNTAVFSPMEGSDDHPPPSPSSQQAPRQQDNPENSDQRDTLRPSDMPPSPTASTVAALPSITNSRASAIKPDDVQFSMKPKSAAGKWAPPDPNETPQARKEREQAEMSALLGRAGQRKTAVSTAESASPATDLLNDADKLEDDVAAGRDRLNDRPSRPPMSSILDSLGMKEEEKKKQQAEEKEEDEDEDGAQMHARLKDRFAQIEHDMRQDNAVARERAKKAKKAEGKCKCACM